MKKQINIFFDLDNEIDQKIWEWLVEDTTLTRPAHTKEILWRVYKQEQEKQEQEKQEQEKQEQEKQEQEQAEATEKVTIDYSNFGLV